MVGDGAVLARGVADHAASLFAASDGDPRAFFVRGTRKHFYVSYVLGHRGREDQRAKLAHMMVTNVLDRLKEAGAVELVWRRRPVFEYDESRVGAREPVRVTHLRMRCCAINAQGDDVVVQELAKDEGMPIRGDYLRDAEEPRTLLEEDVALTGKTPEALLAGDPDLYLPSVRESDVVAPDEEAVLLCARLTYEATKALNAARNEHTVAWIACKDSTMRGVLTVIREPRITAEEIHARWAADRVADGWVYGETKDAAKKTHPNLVPYATLHSAQREKDALFLAIVRAFFGLEGA